MFLFILQIIVPPLGSSPDTWEQYKENIHNNTDTFTCLDNSTTIPLSSFNDGYVDCADGSDEPSTGANANGTFFCSNAGICPVKLLSWAVGDGVCDCCDGIDEALNPRANCTNTCANLTARRENLTTTLKGRFTKGLKRKGRLEWWGKLILGSKYHQKVVAVPLRAVDKVLTILVKEDRNGTTKTASKPYPSWADPIVVFWNHTFNVPHMKHAFVPVVRKCAIADLKRLKAWLEDKKAQAKLADTPEIVVPAAVPMYARVFEKEKYVLRFMKDVEHKNITIGKFKNLTDYIMWFDGGAHCPKGKGRKHFKLELVCNNVSILVSANGPDSCAYSGVFGTPVACNETLVTELENFKLKKLEKFAGKLQLPIPD
jgi:hypothetical protein